MATTSEHPHVTVSLLKYLEEVKFPYMADINKYEKLAKIGQGTFGEVFKAKNRQTGQMVALKKILMENEKEGKLRDKNITELVEICSSKASQYNRGRSTFYLVFTFCEHDLAGLLSNTNVKFTLADIKCMMKQLFEGLYKIHSSSILHRDMKAANVLLTKDGVLKLADFGLARPLLKAPAPGQEALYTNRVVTLWYRPPELLLGERKYGPPIDLWGAGCIMAEMWTRSPIMQGDTEQRQLILISQLCGSISPEVWDNVDKLPLYSKLELPTNLKRRVQERLMPYVKDPKACLLIDRLLTLDPAKRLDGNAALDHDFFYCDPLPSDLKKMMSQVTTSHFEFTVGRNKRQHNAGTNPAGPPAKQPAGGAATQGQLCDRVF